MINSYVPNLDLLTSHLTFRHKFLTLIRYQMCLLLKKSTKYVPFFVLKTCFVPLKTLIFT